MSIFRTADRQKVLDEIIVFTQQHEHIVSLIAIGSASYGFIDELSDLDMIVAIDRDENRQAVMEFVSSQLSRRLNLIYFKQIPEGNLQIYLADNDLEIDIGYGPYTHAAATRAHWKVLFDKTGTVDQAMRASWEQHEMTPKSDEYQKKLAACSDTVWHNLMHAAVAIKRRQPWRAISEIELARNSYLDLLGCRYALDTGRGRDVDKLPEAELAILKKTLVSSFSQESLWGNLVALTDAVYTELERCGEQTRLPVNRLRVMAYIQACQNL